MRSFCVVGRTAHASSRVRLNDLPGTSGRLDVLARCIRAALCVSHGVRRDTRVYLVLLGDATPHTVRIDGCDAKFIRPDERPLATLLLKTIERVTSEAPHFVEQRAGVAVACAGLEAVLADLPSGSGTPPLFLLDEGGSPLPREGLIDGAFFIGDHTGFDPSAREALVTAGARPVSVGRVSLHSDDVVTVLHHELDRRVP
jgi:tRNA (pseudouridine54-N1)-methyltransferase